MRVPWSIAIPLLLIVPLVVWFTGTAKYDFMTPKEVPEDQLRPEFASPVDPELAAAITEAAQPPPEPSPPPVPDLDVGDLTAIPALDEYRSQAEAGAPALAKLANRLLELGQPLRATLAFERILDSAQEGGADRLTATQVLPSLRSQLPPWNADPLLVTPLTLNIMTSRPEEEFTLPLNTLSKIVRTSSGNLVRLESRYVGTPTPGIYLPSPPIAVWLTVPGEDAENPALAIKTLAPKFQDSLEDALAHSLYELLAKRSQNIGELTSLPDSPAEGKAHKVFQENITLLMWKRILETPFQAITAPVPDVLESESVEETVPGEDFSQDNPQEER